MNRKQKEKVVEELSHIFSNSGVVIVAHYSGLTVLEISKLRFSTRHFPSYEKVRFFTVMLIFIWLIYVIFVYNASVFSTKPKLN